MISNDEETRGHKELQKLQLMLRNLEEHNDLPSPEKSKSQFAICNDDNRRKLSNAMNENMNSPGAKNGDSIKEQTNGGKESLLEIESDIINIEDDISLDDEDSWLLESPVKSPQKPQLWLVEDVKTPALARVKGSLASKLDLISIQNRKEKLSQLLWKHNPPIQADSAPGRLYQAESMCSVMSLDWEYDEDEFYLAFSSSNERPPTASDYYQMTDFDEIDAREMNNGKLKSKLAFTDPQKSNRSDIIVENDGLQPMSLDFESPPIVKRSVQVAQGPIITQRDSPYGKKNILSDDTEKSDDFIVKPVGGIKIRGSKPNYRKADTCDYGNNSRFRSSSLSDQSDSSGDQQISPCGSKSSSRSSLSSTDDYGQRKKLNGSAKGQRRLLPISSLFKHSIEEEEEKHSNNFELDSQNSYFNWNAQRKTTTNCRSLIKPRAPLSISTPDDAGLMVKLPKSSNNVPAIRRRGTSANPSSEVKKQGSQLTDSSFSDTTSTPVIRRSFPAPRGCSKYTQSLDTLSRQGQQSEAKTRVSDATPSQGFGIVPRGQGNYKKYQM